MPRKAGGRPFSKGDPRAGRPKGCPNKFTNLKESVLEVYQRMGGTQALFDWASKSDRNRHDFFAWMLSMLPKDQVLKIEEMIPKKVVIREYDDKPKDEPTK
jgi:hypothetical protein